jgi:hypothetical protein
MGASAQFAAAVRNAIGQVSAANTNRDGTGTIVSVFTAGANGSRVDKITIKAVASTTAGMIRLYIHDGANTRLWREVEVPAVTPSGTVRTFLEEVIPAGGLLLPNGYSLRASTHNAETFNVIAEGGDF